MRALSYCELDLVVGGQSSGQTGGQTPAPSSPPSNNNGQTTTTTTHNNTRGGQVNYNINQTPTGVTGSVGGSYSWSRSETTVTVVTTPNFPRGNDRGPAADLAGLY